MIRAQGDPSITATASAHTLGRSRHHGETFLFLAVGGAVFLSRIPFLGPGFGIQPDAWRVAVTARSIFETGEYSASRFPGNPVPELVCALLWTGGPWTLNVMTALLSGIACAFFALSLKVLGRKDPVLASLALGCVPVVYLYSTMSVDSVWALAFTLSALHFVLLRRSVLAGVMLGIAIGCRITSGAMLLPLALLLATGHPRREVMRAILRLSAATGVVGAAAFAPVIARYRWSWFTFYEVVGYPPWREVVQLATLDVWGSLGFVGLVVALVSIAFNPTKVRAIRFKPLSAAGIQFIAWVLVLTLYAIAYLRLPHQPKYLIPVVPFVIVLLDSVLDRRVFVFVCCMFIASSFVTIGRTGVRGGPILADHVARRQDMAFLHRVISRANSLEERAVVVAGSWQVKIQGLLIGHPPGIADYVYGLDALDLRMRLDQGAVYYLPGIREYNLALFGTDLADFGAKLLLPDEQQ